MDRDEQLGELALALPSRLRPAIASAAHSFTDPIHHLVGEFEAVVEGESVRIPYRQYFAAPSERDLEELSEHDRLVVECLFTRHHDGHVRERFARRIAGRTDPAVPPFVLQLVGEYVIEIAEAIAGHLPRSTEARSTYAEFCAANQSFVSRVRARATSYWNFYYRARFPNRRDYQPLTLLDELCAVPHAQVVGTDE